MTVAILFLYSIVGLYDLVCLIILLRTEEILTQMGYIKCYQKDNTSPPKWA